MPALENNVHCVAIIAIGGASKIYILRNADAQASEVHQRSMEMYASVVAVVRSDSRSRQMYQRLIMRPMEDSHNEI